MTYDQLNADFAMHKPVGEPTGRAFWFEVQWTDKRKSINDLLRDYLKNHGFSYLNTVGGEVWFLFNGEWRKCTAEVNGEKVRFYMMEFDMG